MHARLIQFNNKIKFWFIIDIIRESVAREMCKPRSLGCEDLDLDLTTLLILTGIAASFMAKAGAPADEE